MEINYRIKLGEWEDMKKLNYVVVNGETYQVQILLLRTQISNVGYITLSIWKDNNPTSPN